jgi:GNAT superfamily N-acetyltransferase
MMRFDCQPPLPAKLTDQLFTQTIRSMDGDRTLTHITWTAPAVSEGAVQILELWTDPTVRRAGHARRLMRQLVEQARALHQQRKQPLRRFWIGVGHKTHIVARSFLTSEGFHHIGSTSGLLLDQDLLIYVKSLD